MSIIVNPVLVGYVSIRCGPDAIYTRELNSTKEAANFINKYGKSVPHDSLLKAIFIPLRTDCWKNFAKDLFLPTFINRAIKVDGIGQRVILSVIAIFIDVCTFIPRLISSPFRAVYNQKTKVEHPLISLIKDDDDPSDPVLKLDALEIKIEIKKTDVQRDSKLKKISSKVFEIDVVKTVFLNRDHKIEDNSHFTKRETNYLIIKGEWKFRGSITGKWDPNE